MIVHIERFRVGFQDTDSTSRIYFPTYVRWFDIAFIEFLRKNGVVFDRVGGLIVDGRPLNKTFVVGEYGCRVMKPSKYDDVVEVSVSIKELRNKVVTASFTLADAACGEELANGYITYVFIDLENGRSTEMPNRLRQIFELNR